MPSDRYYERDFAQRNLPDQPCVILDVGCGTPDTVSYMLLRGHRVFGLDMRELPYGPIPRRFEFVRGDIRHTDFASGFFDAVTCLSTLEHVGVAGRYGVTKYDPDGDKQAMSEMRRVMKDGGLLLLTTHFGVRGVFEGLHRIYDAEQIDYLTQGFLVESSEFYCRKEVEPYRYPSYDWHPCDRCEAAEKHQYHGLICLKLRKV